MKHFAIITIALVALFDSVLLANAQRSIGVVKDSPTAATNQIDIPITGWVGRTFIFLEKSKKLQVYGYKLRLSKQATYRTTDPELEANHGNLKYEKFVGKRIKVVSVELGLEYLVTFEEESSGRKIYANSHKGQIQDIALVDDLEAAKSRWLGKTIWTKRKVLTTYDAENDKYGEVKTMIGQPLKIVDVWWGDANVWPIWLIVETNEKEKGYLHTAFSWTNIYEDWWKKNRRPWEIDFFETDPKELGWSEEAWAKIRDGKVVIGMTKSQVVLSWRQPQKVNQTISDAGNHEQWVYGDQYLYFEGEFLKTIQAAK